MTHASDQYRRHFARRLYYTQTTDFHLSLDAVMNTRRRRYVTPTNYSFDVRVHTMLLLLFIKRVTFRIIGDAK